jgi:hypothetical protein
LRTADVRAFPSGTITAQYAFIHAVYQETMYERVGAARRIRWHQAIAHWLEAVAGEQAVEIAAELAIHCEQGRNSDGAIHYLEQAARKALCQGAAHEAIRHVRMPAPHDPQDIAHQKAPEVPIPLRLCLGGDQPQATNVMIIAGHCVRFRRASIALSLQISYMAGANSLGEKDTLGNEEGGGEY